MSSHGWSVPKCWLHVWVCFFYFPASCSSSNRQKWNSNRAVSFALCCSLAERSNFLVYTRWKVSKLETNTFSILQLSSQEKIKSRDFLRQHSSTNGSLLNTLDSFIYRWQCNQSLFTNYRLISGIMDKSQFYGKVLRIPQCQGYMINNWTIYLCLTTSNHH